MELEMDNRNFQDSEDLDRIEIEIVTECPPKTTNNSVANSTSIDLSTSGDTSELIELVNDCDMYRNRRYTDNEAGSTNYDGNNRSTPTNMMRRWSLNMTRFSKSKRSIGERTIFKLPSRKIFEIDGKLLSASSFESEEEIEQLATEIEQHEYLMQDTVIGEQNRLETLRALPQSLHTKRLLKQKLAISLEQKTPERQNCILPRKIYNGFIFVLFKCWSFICIICHGFELWYDSLKTIEGHFGSNVSSYFKFLRWLFVLNTFLFVFTVGFITIPQILYNTKLEYEKTYANETDSTVMATSKLLSALTNVSDHASREHGWKFGNLFTGEGSFQFSLMFYGGYSNETFSMTDSSRKYSLPHAYYMTMLILYLSTLVIISTSMARFYRKSFIETSGGVRSIYAHKIFCSWDYGILNGKAAELKHFTIFTELKELLSELDESKDNLSFMMRTVKFFIHLIFHIVIFSLIGVLAYGVWFMLDFFRNDKEVSAWSLFFIATVVNIAIALFQSIFSWITKMEYREVPRRALHATLVRNFLLETTIVGTMVYFWLNRKYDHCWETAIGQEIYRLIVSDFFISFLLMPILNVIRINIGSRFWPNFIRPEFDISQQSLGLVYNQTLLWVGLLFAPLLAGLMMVKMILVFYIKKAVLMHICKSPRHIWRSAQTHTLYLVFGFLSLLGVIITFGYIMTQIPLTQDCGPFRDYELMFQIFIDGILKLRQNHKIWRILMWLVRPAVVGGILIIMAVMTYYLRAKSRARVLMVKLLQDMLYLEARDKKFLLENIAKITKDREWLFDEMKKNNGNVSSTSSSYKCPSHNRCSNKMQFLSNGNSVKKVQNSDCLLRSRNV